MTLDLRAGVFMIGLPLVIGGLRGYERLLSLSKDKSNPKWKPLNMAGSWNQKNRRLAKQRSKSNWFKGRQEIPGPDECLEADLPEGRKEDLPAGRKYNSEEAGGREQYNYERRSQGGGQRQHADRLQEQYKYGRARR